MLSILIKISIWFLNQQQSNEWMNLNINAGIPLNANDKTENFGKSFSRKTRNSVRAGKMAIGEVFIIRFSFFLFFFLFFFFSVNMS